MAGKNDGDSFGLEIGYPVYAAAFASDGRLLVAGGGGEGKNGIANKISVLDVNIDERKITVAGEKVLSKDEDLPMSLDITNTGVIATGINSASAKIKTGTNEHLRLFKLESDNRIESQSQTQLFTSRQPDEYQKCTRFSQAGTLLAVASSGGTLHTLAFPSLQPQFAPMADDTDEVQDVDFSFDEKLLAYTTPTSVTLLSALTGEMITQQFPPPAMSFRGVRFAGESLIVVANHARKRGASLLKLTLPADIYLTKQQSLPPARTVRALHTGIKAVTALDCLDGLAVVAGADMSISVVRVDTLREIKTVHNAHAFPVTCVAINPAGTCVATTSVAQSVVLLKLDPTASSNRQVMIVSTVVSVVFIVIVGILVQLLVQRQVFQHFTTGDDE
ncbi:hypothetical protein V1512DRAFT_86024 [Lipomyces arxii]|uniref:uncharacterized protein n=1 Tax=Lipomyces arxii TaxID=56418 RepID=UPI0034CDE051